MNTKKEPHAQEGTEVEQYSISESWTPEATVVKKLEEEHLHDEEQIKYLAKFIAFYSKKDHMLRTQKEWNEYYYEYCINQEILKFNEGGNSPFCAHDFTCEHHTHVPGEE